MGGTQTVRLFWDVCIHGERRHNQLARLTSRKGQSFPLALLCILNFSVDLGGVSQQMLQASMLECRGTVKRLHRFELAVLRRLALAWGIKA